MMNDNEQEIRAHIEKIAYVEALFCHATNPSLRRSYSEVCFGVFYSFSYSVIA